MFSHRIYRQEIGPWLGDHPEKSIKDIDPPLVSFMYEIFRKTSRFMSLITASLDQIKTR